MKVCKNVCLVMFGILCITNAMAKTCTVPKYTISYDCGEGKTISLPASLSVTYGQQVDVTLAGGTNQMGTLNWGNCTPPTGKIQAGQEIWAGDTLVGGGPTLLKPFRYYYQSDIVIRPHYATPDEGSEILWDLRDREVPNNVVTYYPSGEGTVNVGLDNFGYITMQGRCSWAAPLNTALGQYTGYEADDQDAITSSSGGPGCYCRLTRPLFNNNKWVYVDSEQCNNCITKCMSAFKTSAVFRASILSGARPDTE